MIAQHAAQNRTLYRRKCAWTSQDRWDVRIRSQISVQLLRIKAGPKHVVERRQTNLPYLTAAIDALLSLPLLHCTCNVNVNFYVSQFLVLEPLATELFMGKAGWHF